MKSIILSAVFILAIASTYAATSNEPSNNNPASTHNAKKNTTVVRNIVSEKLPPRLLNAVKKTYRNYWITELYKETTNGKTSYHITLENADQKVKLAADQPGTWNAKRTILKDAELR